MQVRDSLALLVVSFANELTECPDHLCVDSLSLDPYGLDPLCDLHNLLLARHPSRHVARTMLQTRIVLTCVDSSAGVVLLTVV